MLVFFCFLDVDFSFLTLFVCLIEEVDFVVVALVQHFLNFPILADIGDAQCALKDERAVALVETAFTFSLEGPEAENELRA